MAAEGNFSVRLQATAERIAGLEADLLDERKLRAALILEAMDAGETRADVARWSHLTPTRVSQVVVEQLSVAV
jgi:hypothetical protein